MEVARLKKGNHAGWKGSEWRGGEIEGDESDEFASQQRADGVKEPKRTYKAVSPSPVETPPPDYRPLPPRDRVPDSPY